MIDSEREARTLHREAEELIAGSGLGALLDARFGRFALVGSVDLDLMGRRDIDLYVELGRDEGARLIGAIEPIRAALAAAGHRLFRVSYWDEWHRPRGDYGSGHYLGLRFATPEGAEWKLDLWGWDSPTLAAKLAAHEALKRDLAAADRALLLSLKREVHSAPELRHVVASYDVYRFVLAGAGSTLAELRDWCARR